MHRRTYFTFIFSIALIFAGVISASAQTGTIRGEVKVKNADGTTSAVAGAVVEAVRTDVSRGKLPSSKTDKDGVFVFLGVQPGQTFALNVSGAGAAPGILPNVIGGMEKIEIVLDAGDGKAWTEAEVRSALAEASNLSAEDIEKQKKLIAENQAAKQRAENNHKAVNAALQAGDAAYKAKDFITAIAKFDEGINIDPEFAGSAPVLLNYKGVSYKELGYASYLESSKTTDAAVKASTLATAKEHWTKALDAFNRGLTILNAATGTASKDNLNLTAAKTTDPKELEGYKAQTLSILTNAVETYRLMILTKADATKTTESIPVFEQYLAAETDPVKKAKVQVTFADIMLESGDVDRAVTAYRAVLGDAPNNVDALAGLGLSLVNMAYEKDEKALFQEAVNYLQAFLDVAPNTHKYKGDAESLVTLIKAEQKVTPKKISTNGKN